MNKIAGYEVYENPYLTDVKTTQIIKPWWMKISDIILHWNPCNEWKNPDFKTEIVPSSKVIVANGKLFAHPEVCIRMRTDFGNMPLAHPKFNNFLLGGAA